MLTADGFTNKKFNLHLVKKTEHCKCTITVY